jgi:hypothetical protein
MRLAVFFMRARSIDVECEPARDRASSNDGWLCPTIADIELTRTQALVRNVGAKKSVSAKAGHNAATA